MTMSGSAGRSKGSAERGEREEKGRKNQNKIRITVCQSRCNRTAEHHSPALQVHISGSSLFSPGTFSNQNK